MINDNNNLSLFNHHLLLGVISYAKEDLFGKNSEVSGSVLLVTWCMISPNKNKSPTTKHFLPMSKKGTASSHK